MEKIEFLPFVIIALFSAAIFGMFLTHKFYAILKEKHNEKWQELGSPSLIKNNSVKTCLAAWSFLRKKEYLKTHDPSLIKLSQVLYSFSIIYIIFFLVVVILFILYM